MDWQKEQKIIKMIIKVAEDIQMIGQNLDYIEGVAVSARNSKYELLNIIQLLKVDNEQREKDAKEKAVQHKD